MMRKILTPARNHGISQLVFGDIVVFTSNHLLGKMAYQAILRELEPDRDGGVIMTDCGDRVKWTRLASSTPAIQKAS